MILFWKGGKMENEEEKKETAQNLTNLKRTGETLLKNQKNISAGGKSTKWLDFLMLEELKRTKQLDWYILGNLILNFGTILNIWSGWHFENPVKLPLLKTWLCLHQSPNKEDCKVIASIFSNSERWQSCVMFYFSKITQIKGIITKQSFCSTVLHQDCLGNVKPGGESEFDSWVDCGRKIKCPTFGPSEESALTAAMQLFYIFVETITLSWHYMRRIICQTI